MDVDDYLYFGALVAALPAGAVLLRRRFGPIGLWLGLAGPFLLLALLVQRHWTNALASGFHPIDSGYDIEMAVYLGAFLIAALAADVGSRLKLPILLHILASSGPVFVTLVLGPFNFLIALALAVVWGSVLMVSTVARAHRARRERRASAA